MPLQKRAVMFAGSQFMEGHFTEVESSEPAVGRRMTVGGAEGWRPRARGRRCSGGRDAMTRATRMTRMRAAPKRMKRIGPMRMTCAATPARSSGRCSGEGRRPPLPTMIRVRRGILYSQATEKRRSAELLRRVDKRVVRPFRGCRVRKSGWDSTTRHSGRCAGLHSDPSV
jgi:hypothetical protein